MKKGKRSIAAFLAATLVITGIPFSAAPKTVLAAEPDVTIKLQPNLASVFNDTNGDGLGEFEGWGTSLCWWANRLGYSESLTRQAGEKFFGDAGLDLNIGRYNVGGGDLVGEETPVIPVNEKAVFYDLETEGYMPTYAGSKMTISTNKNFASATYEISDADFGITKGTKVGNLKVIGYVNQLDGTVASGDNLHYTVHADEAGEYTVKLMLTMTGTNSRDAAIRVNGETDYVVSSSEINANEIVSINVNGTNNMLYLVTIPNVVLKEGDNSVNVAGKSGWTLDFIKMAVIKKGEEGVITTEQEYLHSPHITRSDSAVPGYATDVTKIVITDEKTLEWYQESFARVDESCGYAWNYDWDADANQLNILKAAAAESGEEFIAEAFSNSPPYFMTNSGCTSGAIDSSKDNLREDSIDAFAGYMADVIEHWNEEGLFTFQSVSPMNEPHTDYWGAYSYKQEGCRIGQGTMQSELLVALSEELEEKGLDIIISGTDETSIDTQITSYNALSDEAKAVVERIDTHTYGGSQRASLSALAETEGKNLWMSEVDGKYTAGTNAGEMTAALGLAQRIMTDVNGLKATAWILWNAVDANADESTYETYSDYKDMEALYEAIDMNGGYWGVAYADHNNEELVLTKKYYGYGQFTRYIRPGYTIMGSSANTLAAYDSEGNKAVIVAINTEAEDKTYEFSLSSFKTMGDEIAAIRTSGDLATGENWANVTDVADIAVDTAAKTFTTTLKANSITTYIVEGVTYDETVALEEIPLDASMVTGSNPWNNDTSHDVSKVVDNDLSTFFDGVTDGWLMIDLGESTAIEAFSYAPRSGYTNRCVGASVYGSNDGETWTRLYTITENVAAGALTYVYAEQFAAEENEYRYFKYAVPEGDTSANCNIAEIKLYTIPVVIEEGVTAHYDMSYSGNVLNDISGNNNDAVLYNASASDFTAYGDEVVMQFANHAYAELPSGLIGEDGIFTIQTTFSTHTQANHWLWCLGQGIGNWGAGTIGDYIFVSPKSAQWGYQDKMLSAVKVGNEASGGEKRLPAPADTMANGYVTATLVSDGATLTLYMDGVNVSTLTHGFDLSSVIPDGDVLGYIGRSLYNGDALITANISDMKIWNQALTAEKVQAQLPTAEDKADMMLADIRKAMLKENTSENKIETDVAFPQTIDGVAVTWNIPENTAIAADGKVTVPAGDDVSVDITASFEVDGAVQKATFALTVPGENVENLLNNALEELDIPNKEDVRGNITLPKEMDGGVTVTWTTSHPEIVDVESREASVENYDAVPAGVVTRPAEDTVVTMTATLELKGEIRTKEIQLQVKAAPETIEESDYTDYFFAYFAGEGYANGEQIYFASSQDGLNWADLNDASPVLNSTLGEQGVRDPFLIRSPEGDKFYLIATDLKIYGNGDWDAAQNRGSQSLMVWESSDLVNWSEQRMVEVSASIGAGCTWAPEATYDPVTGEYIVYWASRTPEIDTKQRVYYAKTRDFYTFTEPELYIEKDQSSIDTTMIEHDGTYYRYTKNEGGSTNELGVLTKSIFIEKSSNVLGTFTHIASESLNQNQWVEGPTIFKLNEDDAEEDTWCLLVDNYGSGGYYPLVTNDLESGQFENPTGYRMPSYARHGTPIRITAEEYAAITTAYTAPDEIVTATYADQAPALPEQVTYTNGDTVITKPVTWNMDDATFDAKPFKYVTVTGEIEGSAVQAIAQVQILPEDLEYMIDCNNPQSETWANALAIGAELMNAEAADQAKTDDNTWGYISTVGTSGQSVDMTAFSQSNISNPYTGGWWAHSGANIEYQVTLPAGEHQILTGCTGWWSMGRAMDVYYSVNGGSFAKLFDFDAVTSTETYAQGSITLEEKSVVTLSVRAAASNDPILSWIAVTGEGEKDVIVYDSITGTNGEAQYDTNGNRIQAHGGQVQQFTVDGETKYYWYGEDRSRGFRPVTGVHLYTSTDLYNWTDEGVVFKSIPVSADEYGLGETNLSVFTDNEYFKSLYNDYEGQPSDTPELYESKLEETYWNLAEDRCIMERPKVIYNEATDKYVLWFHADGHTPESTSNYGKAQAGVAISDTPYGPFKLVGTYDLYYSQEVDYEAVNDHPGAVRDMNVFVDADGTAYISYSSEMNQTTYIGKLNDTYTGLATDPDEAVQGVDYTRNFIGQSREASAMFLYDGKYYMITSGCTGWNPNQAQYAVADTPLGPWTTKGDPCIGDYNSTTFDSQSACVIPVDPENGKYIYMGDRWYNASVNGGDLSDSRYVWLPIKFASNDRIALRDHSDWTLEDLGGKEELLINGGFEKGLVSWHTDSGASIGTENAPEGAQYCAEDGTVASWGSGISQHVMVEPNTEYVLTGIAKPDENALFWVGAEVDGREIYAVLSADSTYTDTTDDADKLAYSVLAGVTDWTKWEVRFTTGADTETVKIYTWISGGTGVIDNLSLKADTSCRHEATTLVGKSEATCTEAGYTGDVVCEVCGEVVEVGKTVESSGHNWNDWIVTDATCTNVGSKERTCAACGEKETEEIPMLAHTEVIDKAVKATCTETGLTEGKHCSVCNEVLVKQEVIEAAGHKWTDWAVTEATCEKAGSKVRLCPACGESERETIPALGHTEVVDEAVAATCTEAGLTEGKHCSVCNKVLVKQEVVEATGHSFGEWVTVKEPTTEAEGLKERVCANCDEKEEEKIEKLPQEVFVNPFKDVKESDWYYKSVMWGAKNQVIAGMAPDMFQPLANCTRAQIVTFIWRAAGKPEATITECTFKDVDADGYYYEAMLWGTEHKIISGYDADTFAPNATCTRAELVTFLWRIDGFTVVTDVENTFADVKETDWFYNAVLWAKSEGITSGYTPTTCAPNVQVTRAETVAMLHRYYK